MNNNSSGSNCQEKRKRGISRWETEESDSDKEENKRLKSDMYEKESNRENDINHSNNIEESNEKHENYTPEKEVKIIEHNPLIEV